jgi:hypothetical protein
MRQLKLVQELGEKRIKENGGWVNSTMIYCKNYINVRMYPLYNNNIIENKIKSNKNCKMSCLTLKIQWIIGQGVFYFISAANTSCPVI